MKLAVVAPEATVTDAGTVRTVLLSDTVTLVLLVAAFDSVTVQAEVPLEAIVAGEHASFETVTAGAERETEADTVKPFSDALTVALWLLVTVPAWALKVVLVAPLATVTEAGTVNTVLLSDTVTAVLLVAAFDSVTVQVEVAFEEIVEGEHARLETITEVPDRVTVVDAETPFRVAVTVAFWLELTVPVLALKVAEATPLDTVTDDGTVSSVLLSDSVTVVALVAAFDSVTVQTALEFEEIVAGEHATAESVAVGAESEMDAVAEAPFREAVTVAV